MTEAATISADKAETAFGERFRWFLRGLVRALRVANLTGLAAQVSYSLIFALPSILLMVVLAGHGIDERSDYLISKEIRTLIVETLPVQVRSTVDTLINDAMVRARQGVPTITAILSILIALFAAGNGLGELATAFDRAASIDDPRPAWQKRFLFTASAILIAMMLVIGFTVYVWWGDLMALLAQRLGVEQDWENGWRLLQAPVILLLVFLGTTVLYMTSSGRYCFRETAPGAAVATLLWLAIVKGFQFYLQVAPPATAYGAASSVLVFLVFLYLSSMALIIGALTAAVIVRQSREGTAYLQEMVFQPVRPRGAAHADSKPDSHG